MKPNTVEDFTNEKEYNKEEKDKNINSLDNVNFNINKISKEIYEQGIQIEEKKPEKKEKTTDRYDSEKREIKITKPKILKKSKCIKT